MFPFVGGWGATGLVHVSHARVRAGVGDWTAAYWNLIAVHNSVSWGVEGRTEHFPESASCFYWD